MNDLKSAFRTLSATPIVTLVAVLSLALGIGANTAIFSILDTLMLRSLPVKAPHQLAVVGIDQDRDSWTYPIWEQVRQRADLFDGAFAYSSSRFNLSRTAQTEWADGFWGSGRVFEVLGVPAILGRTFTDADDRRGGGPDGAVAVISYRYWQSKYGGAGDVIGQTLTIERVPYTIVGVTPPEFSGSRSAGRSTSLSRSEPSRSSEARKARSIGAPPGGSASSSGSSRDNRLMPQPPRFEASSPKYAKPPSRRTTVSKTKRRI